MKFAEVYDYYFVKRENELKGEELVEYAEKDLEEYARIEQERKLLELGKGLGFLATTCKHSSFYWFVWNCLGNNESLS